MGFDRSDDSSVKQIIIEGLTLSFNMFFNLTLRNESNQFVRLESIQMTLDAMFNLVMRIGQNNVDSFHILTRATDLIDELIESVKSEHYGPSLYYKFKQRQFLAIYWEEQGAKEAALKRYKEAMQVWWEMHKLKSYGSGNGAHDPYAEGCGILYDIAALSSIQQDYQTCLESIDHIIHFYEEVWSKRPKIPLQVIKNHALRLGIGGTCAMSIGNGVLAIQYLNEALLLFQQANEIEYARQTEALLSTVTINQKSEILSNPHEDGTSIEGDPQSMSGSSSRRVYRRKKRS